MTAILEGAYELPRGVLVVAPVVGTEWDVRVGDVPGICAMPRPGRNPTDFFDPLLPPARAAPPEHEIRWGHPHPQAGHFSVESVYLSFPVDLDAGDVAGATSVAKSIEERVDAWVGRLCDWVEALTGQDLDLREPLVTGRIPGRGLLLRCKDEAGRWLTVSMPRSIIYLATEDSYCSVAQWQFALGRASVGAELPEPNRYFVLARRGMRREHGRRALLDAGTAVELALKRALDDLPGGVDQAGAKVRTDVPLGRLAQVCKDVGLAVPSTIKPDLIEPRNMAAHEGNEPGYDVTLRALQAAEKVVSQYSPLPQP